MIDLRSDTVTRPTPAMRQAMATAPVGDDVMGDDPTVKALEQKTADLLGKEAAAFMPSGTMTNQIAIRTHTEPGDEIIVDANAHVYYYEGGAPAALSGVMCRLISTPRGLFTSEQLKEHLRPANLHFPRTKLVCLENTHNRGGGAVWPLDQLIAVTQTAHDAKLAAHLDGARLWNAAVYLGVPERQIAEHFDSVSVCFSKGLGAPVGSALVGSRDFIARARRFRKMLGGAMRQSGIIAAGALYALDHHRARLADDHRRAQKLAAALAALPNIVLNPADVQTNLIIAAVKNLPAAELAARLAQHGIAIQANNPQTIRLVTHLDLCDADIDQTIAILQKVLKS